MTRVLVPHAPDSAGLVRRQVVAELRARHLPAVVVEDAALVVSELIGNAVRHGRPLPGGSLTAVWGLDRQVLHVEVQDGGAGPRPDAAAAPGPDAVGGRGLMLVQAVSRDWGVRLVAGGCSVWVDLALPAVAVA